MCGSLTGLDMRVRIFWTRISLLVVVAGTLQLLVFLTLPRRFDKYIFSGGVISENEEHKGPQLASVLVDGAAENIQFFPPAQGHRHGHQQIPQDVENKGEKQIEWTTTAAATTAKDTQTGDAGDFKVEMQTEVDTSDVMECNPESECERFQNHTWREGQIQAAIIYLARSDRIAFLQRSLALLHKNFNHEHMYPIIIFHERSILKYQLQLRKGTPAPIYFQQLQFQVPLFIEEKRIKYRDQKCPSWIGFRHMSRFYSRNIFRHPILSSLEYYWRLDDDSRITRHIDYDLFDHMKKNSFLYGYVTIHLDQSDCTKDLWDATRRYIQENNIEDKFFEDWFEPKIYYSNFEILRISAFKSVEYTNFVDYIDRLGGIYYYRWGDAAIRSLAISLFVEKERIHYFEDVHYEHKGVKNP